MNKENAEIISSFNQIIQGSYIDAWNGKKILQKDRYIKIVVTEVIIAEELIVSEKIQLVYLEKIGKDWNTNYGIRGRTGFTTILLGIVAWGVVNFAQWAVLAIR